MRRRILRQTDVQTGQVLEGLVVYLAPKRQNGFLGRWFAMGQEEALDALLQFTRLEDFRVLIALLKKLDYENHIAATQADVARMLGMQPSHVSRAVKRLIEAGAILKGPKVGVNYSYRLNPEFGWKGSGKNHVNALKEHQKEKRKLALVPEKTSTETPDKDPT